MNAPKTSAGIAQPLGWLDHALRPVYGLSRIVAALAVIVCAALSTADILSTWLLHRALLGVPELLQMLMVVIIFLGLAPAVRGGTHISVDIFRKMLPAPMRQIGDALSALVSLIVYVLMAYAGIFAALRSLEVGEYANGAVPYPLFPARMALTAGAWLAALAALTAAAVALVTAFRPRRS